MNTNSPAAALPDPQENPQAEKAPIPAWMKISALLLALVIVTGATVAMYSLNMVRQTTQNAIEAFQPQTKYVTILSGAIGKMNDTAKLVVLTVPVGVTVTQESTTTFAGFSVGSAKAEVTVPAVIQYDLKIKDISMNDFYYDALNKRLVVSIPHPTIDTDIVEIESDPAKIKVRTELGWSPLSIFKGAAVREGAMKHLKESAIEIGRHELIQERADKNAKEVVGGFLGQVKDALQSDGVRVEVEFKKQ